MQYNMCKGPRFASSKKMEAQFYFKKVSLD